ncbi:hypothetical protein M408DRAFT_248853 [Serendipita vermifera MAFF 305830]|uniref:Importin-13 n=1 Tax=Serendipita vermifera MAFF 305830 TaxID=933852 RepID=A0A0C3AGX6_SERVB|nr:hypothetical protein M408DRAFT_248853 [Serendipita vermifera MAFF 305830]
MPFSIDGVFGDQLVLQATTLINTSISPSEQQARQQALSELVNSPDAWGLIVPFLEHHDVNVQFYGAHIAGVKVVRDWNSIGPDFQLPLRDTMIMLTARAISQSYAKMVLRRLYVAITALALKLTLTSPPKWPDFLTYTLSILQSQGANTETLLEFMTIAVEEVHRAPRNLNNQIAHALNSAAPAFLETFSRTVTLAQNTLSERHAAFQCLHAWVTWGLTGNDLTSLIPTLITTLSVPELFVPTSSVLQDILTTSSLSSGAATKTLTEPLLAWLSTTGHTIVDSARAEGHPNDLSSSLCKLLCALGDHSNAYIAKSIVQVSKPAGNLPSTATSSISNGLASKSQTDAHVQEFLRCMLIYTGFPGYYGIEEEDSEATLGFWYLLQESLWEVVEIGNEDDEEDNLDWVAMANSHSIRNAVRQASGEAEMVEDDDDLTPALMSPHDDERPPSLKAPKEPDMAQLLFTEVVSILRRKITWPKKSEMADWDAEQRENFGIYRRNVGDTLINACYVLRERFLDNMLTDMKVQLAQSQNVGNDQFVWEDIEASLFCIKAVHDALTASYLKPLGFLFEEATMAALPQSGSHRVRWTMLTLIGEYASYFSSKSIDTSTSSLLRAVNYTVTALAEPSLCLQASMTLKELCDANRVMLAPHLNSFADLHRNVELLGSEEKSKVLESIASVISAMPPEAGIEPVRAVVQPLLESLARALSGQMPEETAQILCISQLRSLTGTAKGLTVISDPLEDTIPVDQGAVSRARQDPRMIKVREDVVAAVDAVTNRWWADAEVISVLSELIKAITATPAEESILSLPPQPLLRIIANSIRRQVTSTWLTLATIVTGQLYPTISLENLHPTPSEHTVQFVAEMAPEIIAPCLAMMTRKDAMEENPDIVQEFFRFCETVAHHFLTIIYRLPQDLLSSLLLHAISALSLQERYSLVGSCKFLLTLMRDTFSNGDLGREADALMEIHGNQIATSLIYGVASVAPRSTLQNLSEVLHCLASRRPAQTRMYLRDILFSAEFTAKHPLATQKAKEQFLESLLAARSGNKARLAITQFQNVTRGLEGASYGYATV